MAEERLHLRLDAATGNLFLDLPDSIPPRHILDLLHSRFGATIVSRSKAPSVTGSTCASPSPATNSP